VMAFLGSGCRNIARQRLRRACAEQNNSARTRSAGQRNNR